MESLLILGRQPELGLAELESIYGSNNIQPVGRSGAIAKIDPTEIDFSRLGGMVKFCKVLITLETTNWPEIRHFLVKSVPAHASTLPEGKLRLGLSVYGLTTNSKELLATGLEIKKTLKKSGRPVRFVPNKELALNSAQVLHNQLTSKLGWELVLVRDKNKTIVAQSIAVQDIERYSARDQARPYRDSRVGMLPPKLAQIIINLSSTQPKATPKTHILDPFCGTGVLLQEALLMGFSCSGSDLDERMTEYSIKNLAWLKQNFKIRGQLLSTKKGDATTFKLKPTVDTIACETFLGRPLTSLPDRPTLNKIIRDCDTIHTKFLKNIAKQTDSGFRLCMAVPAWNLKSHFKHLPTLDNLQNLGYNRVKFTHAKNHELIYCRPGQTVARELVVLERI